MFRIQEQNYQHGYNVFSPTSRKYETSFEIEHRDRFRHQILTPRHEEQRVPRCSDKSLELPTSGNDRRYNSLTMYPEVVIQRIRKNYIKLKEDITPNYIIDALVSGDVISSTEEENIKNKTREEGADVILKKVLREKRHVNCFIEALENHGYNFLVQNLIEEENGKIHPRIPTEHDMGDTVSDFEMTKRLKQNEKFLVEELDVLQYIDFFLQEDVFTVTDHDDILTSPDRRRGVLAKLFLSKLLNKIPRSYYCFIQVLNEKGRGYIVRKLEETCVNETLEQNVLDIDVKMRNATICESPCLDVSNDVTALRLVISKSPEGGREIYMKLVEHVPQSEETIIHTLHTTVNSSGIGSLIIYLQVESSEFQSRLCRSVKDDSISVLLRQLFDHCDVTSILDEEMYDLEVVIETCNKSISKTVSRESLPIPRPEPRTYTGWKQILWQNFALLKEEFDPLALSQKLEAKGICVHILRKLGSIPRRRDRVDEFIKSLMNEPENEISSFLTFLKEYGSQYIKQHLYLVVDDDQKRNQGLDIDIVRKNILDNVTFLMDELDTNDMESDFVCKDVLAQDYFTKLTQRNIRRRQRVKMFLKTILDIGKPAIEVFISSLRSQCNHHIVDVLLRDREEERKLEPFLNEANIKYDFYDTKKGLIFHGNFVLTVSKPAEEKSEHDITPKDGKNTQYRKESNTKDITETATPGADADFHSVPGDGGNSLNTSTPSVEDSESIVTDSDCDDSESTDSDTDASCLCASFSSSTSNYSSFSEEYDDICVAPKRKSNEKMPAIDKIERERLETESAKLQGHLTVMLRDCETVQKLIQSFQQTSAAESKIVFEQLLGQKNFNVNKDSIYKLREIDFLLRHSERSNQHH